MPGEHHGAFGEDAFGRGAEKIARFFGTPKYIFGQTIIVAVWIAINAVAVSLQWDPYPFILLNLAFSTQAAYAAPLILLAQTRQADRDKLTEDRQEHHHDEAERLAQERVVAIKSETVQLGRVVLVPEDVQELLVGDLLGVVRDVDHLCVSGRVRADVLIGRVVERAALVADLGLGDTVQLAERRLDAPETAGAERCLLC